MQTEHTLWVEKYRPSDLETYIGNDQLKSKVKHYLDSGDLPHLLFLERLVLVRLLLPSYLLTI